MIYVNFHLHRQKTSFPIPCYEKHCHTVREALLFYFLLSLRCKWEVQVATWVVINFLTVNVTSWKCWFIGAKHFFLFPVIITAHLIFLTKLHCHQCFLAEYRLNFTVIMPLQHYHLNNVVLSIVRCFETSEAVIPYFISFQVWIDASASDTLTVQGEVIWGFSDWSWGIRNPTYFKFFTTWCMAQSSIVVFIKILVILSPAFIRVTRVI